METGFQIQTFFFFKRDHFTCHASAMFKFISGGKKEQIELTNVASEEGWRLSSCTSIPRQTGAVFSARAAAFPVSPRASVHGADARRF